MSGDPDADSEFESSDDDADGESPADTDTREEAPPESDSAFEFDVAQSVLGDHRENGEVGSSDDSPSSGEGGVGADAATDVDTASLEAGAGVDSMTDTDLSTDADGKLDLDDAATSDDEGLFDDLLAGDPIFVSKEVLRPSYTPRELPHRNEQINKMATILVSALRGDTPSNILIYGKTGTGKTASAKYVSQELERTSQKYEVPCDVEYINCEVTDTQYRVLAQLANQFNDQNREAIAEEIADLEALRERAEADPSVLQSNAFEARAAGDPADSGDESSATRPEGADAEDAPAATDLGVSSIDEIEERIEQLEADRDEIEEVPMTGWPTDRVYNVFFDAVDYRERVVVIMLDEIDKLVEKSGDDTLYNLSRMNSDLENSRVSIIGISNDLKFTDLLDPRVRSSLGEEEIVFPPYDATQLQDILEHRSEEAFEPNALSEDVIPLCAAFAAQEHGDARRALDLLRTSGELAERDQVEEIQGDHVRKAQEKIELDRVVEVVRTLPMQSKLVLYAIILLEKRGVAAINTGEVYNVYDQLCEEIDADPLTQRRVTDLISELDMLGIVNAVVVSKGRYGRTKEINLSVPREETEAVLTSDSRLGEIEDAQPYVQSRFDG
ncbi:Cdc6/Cdc18 family protein [Salinarchaeum laminariae]|uniref:Cdc6/Cdc18 family protein n=1 Tax=Salinarchaeum laminariae TaxID=869888 RepID=UPI0035BF4DBA